MGHPVKQTDVFTHFCSIYDTIWHLRYRMENVTMIWDRARKLHLMFQSLVRFVSLLTLYGKTKNPQQWMSQYSEESTITDIDIRTNFQTRYLYLEHGLSRIVSKEFWDGSKLFWYYLCSNVLRYVPPIHSFLDKIHLNWLKSNWRIIFFFLI